MTYAEKNRALIVEYFQSGAQDPRDCGRLGVEIEHFIVYGKDSSPVYYEPHMGVVGVRQILEGLEDAYPQPILTPDGDLLGRINERGTITLEPAAQIEISLSPYRSLADIERAYREFRDAADAALAQYGCRIATHGYHPSAKALDLPLIPKKRYDFMNSHFAAIGSHGERMMRASAATQVSIDFSSEADAVRKYRVATALGPILAAFADNTPVFEGEKNRTPLARFSLWRDVDNARCGIVPTTFNEGFGFAHYADWLLDASPIFVTRPAADNPEGPVLRSASEPARIAYADAPMNTEDIEHLLSMFWPDVRLKRYLEIRPADSLPPDLLLGYVALIKGVFYSEESLAAIEKLLGVKNGIWPLTPDDVEEAAENIRQKRLAGLAYGTKLIDWIATLFNAARKALPGDERHYLSALEAFAFEKPWLS